jgi:NAD(P)-dependent dehydrogenase (short-subunit alcohol dehydrogenase family)
MDMADLRSVVSAAKELLQYVFFFVFSPLFLPAVLLEKNLMDYRKEKYLHGLVNNAGIMATPFELTTDGYESQFQVRSTGLERIFYFNPRASFCSYR